MKDKLKQQLITIISNVLKISEHDALSAAYGQHYAWDSLSHVMLIANIETRLGIKYNPEEIPKMINLNEILKYTIAKES